MQRASIASVCPYCGVGCGLYITTEAGKITGLDYMTEHPVNEGALCPKGNASLDVVYHHDRLLYPMQRVDGRLERTSWADALNSVAANLNRIQAEFGPDALGFLVSAGATNEEIYLFQKLARMLGTNNINHRAHLWHGPFSVGLIPTLGAGAMTNPIVDLAHADCIFVIGSNFTASHPIVSRWTLDAKQRGAKLIVADVQFTPTAWSADLFLSLSPGSETLLVNAMMNVIIAEGLWNREFVDAHVEGFDELRDSVSHYAPERVATRTGLSVEDIRAVAKTYATSPASSVVCGPGSAQQPSDAGLTQALADLALLTGQIGRPGTGVNPLLEQANTRGACDMGALPDLFPGYRPVTSEVSRRRFAGAWGLETEKLSPKAGLDLGEIAHAIEAGELRGMFILGENPIVAGPDAAQTTAALEKLDFLAMSATFPSETTGLAHVLLPGASFAEKRGTQTATDRRVQWLDQAVEPVGESMSEWKIISRLAARLGFEKQFTYPHEEAVFYEIRAMIPGYAGFSPERLQSTLGGIPWPCLATDHPGTPILYTQSFGHPGGKGRLVPAEIGGSYA